MLQTLGDLFVTVVTTLVKLTLDSFGPPTRGTPESSDLPDSQTLIAHFQSMRDAAARRMPPAPQPPNAPPVPPNAPQVPPNVAPPPANAATAHEPPAVPAAAAPPSAASIAQTPAQPSRFVRPDSGNADVQMDREAFEALRLETPPPGAPASVEGLAASPVRHGTIDPTLAHEFAIERAKGRAAAAIARCSNASALARAQRTARRARSARSPLRARTARRIADRKLGAVPALAGRLYAARAARAGTHDSLGGSPNRAGTTVAGARAARILLADSGC